MKIRQAASPTDPTAQRKGGREKREKINDWNKRKTLIIDDCVNRQDELGTSTVISLSLISALHIL